MEHFTESPLNNNKETGYELTILMPCLNEAETLERCIKKARQFLDGSAISGEVLIADNGSTDGSQEIARNCGARVIDVSVRGYGAALIAGTNAAYGKFIIMGDADDSYNFLALQPFVDALRNGFDLVMGNRFKGGIAKDAMPPLHKYFGNPVLSGIGRLFFRSNTGDFHCGLRGYNKESILSLNLHTIGMEYASEMVVKATLCGLKITEVPTTLDKDGRSRPPHLRSFRDGWRHLKFLLIFAPNWLFVYPGIFCFLTGIIGLFIFSRGPVFIGGIGMDIHTMLFIGTLVILGFKLILFSVFSHVFAIEHNYLPEDKIDVFYKNISSEKCIIAGIALFFIGIGLSFISFAIWVKQEFRNIDFSAMFRLTLPAMLCMVLGLETVFAGFFIGVLKVK